MERKGALPVEYMNHCDIAAWYGSGALNRAVPIAGVGTVCPDKFLGGELLVGVMPAHHRLGRQKAAHGGGILCQHRLPVAIQQRCAVGHL